MTHDAVRPVSPGGRRFSDVMPVAMLPAFIERQGGAVVAVPVAAGGPLTAQVAVQDGARFHAPALDAHFVEIALRGSARGSVHAEGALTGPDFDAQPGRISFLPAGRESTLDVRGASTFLQVTIDRGLMDATMAELLRGGGADAELLGFNTLIVPELEALLWGFDPDRPLDPLAADTLARRLCAVLVSNFSTGRLAAIPTAPGLSTAQLVRVIELTEARPEAGPDRLAASVDLPPGYFAAAFEAETGVTPAAFVEERRVDRVRAWLDEEGDVLGGDLAPVARVCGFADASAMEAAFLARTGVTVAAYRAARV